MARLSDIAAICNVSSATVSRVLNGDASLSVSKEVAEHILSTAADLGYKTPRMRKKADDRLSVVIFAKAIARPGFEESLIKKLEPLADKYSVGFSIAHEAHHADGCIFIGNYTDEEIKELSQEAPVVLINCKKEGYKYDRILMDYDESERMVIDFFLSKGINDIGYFGGIYNKDGVVIGLKRQKGFYAALENAGVFKAENNLIASMDSYSSYHAVLMKEKIPEGIIFSNSEFAFGALKALKERSLKPVTVVYQDIEVGSYELESNIMEIYSGELWETAVHLLLEKIQGSRTLSIAVSLPGKIRIL